MMPPLANIIIQCRFASTRLPGKALYPLCGTPLLVFLIRRLKTALPAKAFRIILATTQNREDHLVAQWAQSEKVPVVRGSEADVLSRYIKVLSEYPSDVHVRVTADNPLTCPEIIKKTVSLLRENTLDYVLTSSFPYGAGVDAFSTSALTALQDHASAPADREHINKYILDHPEKFNLQPLEAEDTQKRPDVNLSVDTLDDFRRVLGIVSLEASHNRKPWRMPLIQAITHLDTLNRNKKNEYVENPSV